MPDLLARGLEMVSRHGTYVLSPQYTVELSGADEDGYVVVNSVDEWRATTKKPSYVHMYVKFNGETKYHFKVNYRDDGKADEFTLILDASLWMPALDVRDESGDRDALEISLKDYSLCKRMFMELGMRRMAASGLENFPSKEEKSADEAFLFTWEGPQKLIRPLEEVRLPRGEELWGEGSDWNELRQVPFQQYWSEWRSTFDAQGSG